MLGWSPHFFYCPLPLVHQSTGSIYALIALGYSMVYGIILLLNFAHGDIIMVGAYMSWFVMNQLGLGPVTAVCASIITCTLLGVVIEKIAYTPLRSAPRLSLLITAIGVSFFLEYTAELILGSGAKVIPSYFDNQVFRLGSVNLSITTILTLGVTVVCMVVLTLLVQQTKLGKAMRAVPGYPHHGLDAGPESLRRRRSGRHRLHPRRHDRRPGHRRLREPGFRCGPVGLA